MSDRKNLTSKQKYLAYLLPKMNDAQVDRMIAAANNYQRFTEAASKHNTNSYDELMAMVGCRNAKEQLKAMIADFRMRKIAEARGKSPTKTYLHAAFTGNPGCGKTMFARLYAKILADEGIIKNNRFIETSRAGLIGHYAGTTAAKVRSVVNQAKGGVLFIDEAYALCEGKNSYGDEAINELIVCLENQPDTMVIFAGYPDRMEEFLASNPGLRSRIPYLVQFDDYSTDELIEISKVIAEKRGFVLTASAIEKLTSVYAAAKREKDFGNGRYVRNVIEAAVRKKGLNLGVMEQAQWEKYGDSTVYSDDLLFSLDESCISCPSEPQKAAGMPIGFVV